MKSGDNCFVVLKDGVIKEATVLEINWERGHLVILWIADDLWYYINTKKAFKEKEEAEQYVKEKYNDV